MTNPLSDENRKTLERGFNALRYLLNFATAATQVRTIMRCHDSDLVSIQERLEALWSAGSSLNAVRAESAPPVQGDVREAVARIVKDQIDTLDALDRDLADEGAKPSSARRAAVRDASAVFTNHVLPILSAIRPDTRGEADTVTVRKPRPYPHASSGTGKYAESLHFEEGSLTVQTTGYGNADGYGWLCFNQDFLEPEQGEDGKHYWIANLAASELIALRDRLNELWPYPAPPIPAEVERLREAFVSATKHLAPGDWTHDKAGMIWAPSLKGGATRIYDVRGWGYLTGRGHGALDLTEAEAVAAQMAWAEFVVVAARIARAALNTKAGG